MLEDSPYWLGGLCVASLPQCNNLRTPDQLIPAHTQHPQAAAIDIDSMGPRGQAVMQHPGCGEYSGRAGPSGRDEGTRGREDGAGGEQGMGAADAAIHYKQL